MAGGYCCRGPAKYYGFWRWRNTFRRRKGHAFTPSAKRQH